MIELEGIITSIEACYKTGEFIVEKCQNWRHANDEVDERINQVEVIWDKTRQQTGFLQRVDHILDDEYRRILDDSIGQLGTKLSNAVTSLQAVTRHDEGRRRGFHGFGFKVRKGKYAFIKDALDEIIKDLEDCHKRFDPTWYLVLRMATPVIDQQLKEMKAASTGVNGAVAKSGKHLRSPLDIAEGVRAAIRSPGPAKSMMRDYLRMNRSAIPYSTATLANRWSESKGTNLIFIVDTLHRYNESSAEDLEKDVRTLAQRLVNSDPYTFGLLRCKCPMRAPRGSLALNSYELVLHVPPGMKNPTSLRHMLLRTDGQALPSLTRRLKVAQQLANSISYVHNFDFVHKGVCPESVLLLEDAQDSQRSPYTFLVGFGNFRAANAETALIGDAAWEKNIYRHPERQGEYPQNSYRMQHDVYSLGVCLLEIGLWQSLVEYVSESQPQSPKDSKLHKDFQAWLESRSVANQTEDFSTSTIGSQVSHPHRKSLLLRGYLVDLAETRLPQTMGELYTDVVVACLSPGGDEMANSEAELGREAAEDKDGISVGVHFIEEILGKLVCITL